MAITILKVKTNKLHVRVAGYKIKKMPYVPIRNYFAPIYENKSKYIFKYQSHMHTILLMGTYGIVTTKYSATFLYQHY
jgi:hypothetical protein